MAYEPTPKRSSFRIIPAVETGLHSVDNTQATGAPARDDQREVYLGLEEPSPECDAGSTALCSARKDRLITGLYHLANLGALRALENTGALYFLFVSLSLRRFPIFPNAGIVIRLAISSHVGAGRGIW